MSVGPGISSRTLASIARETEQLKYKDSRARELLVHDKAPRLTLQLVIWSAMLTTGGSVNLGGMTQRSWTQTPVPGRPKKVKSSSSLRSSLG